MSLLLLNKKRGLPSNNLIAEYKLNQRNLLRFSMDFSNSVWQKTDVTCTYNAGIAPDGTQTAVLIEDASATANGVFLQTVSIMPTDTSSKVISAYFKQGTAAETMFTIKYSGGTSEENMDGVITWSTNTVSCWNTGRASIQGVGNGWYRVSVYNQNQYNSTQCHIRVYPSKWTSTGDTTGSVYFWGPQLENGSVATAYQVTNDNQLIWNSPLTNKAYKTNFTNIIANGNLSDSTWSNTWGTIFSTVSAYSGGVLSFTATQSSGCVVQLRGNTVCGDLAVGHKYFLAVDVNANSNLVCLAPFNGSKVYHSGGGSFERLYCVTGAYALANGDAVIAIVDERTTGWATIQIKNIVGIDLTAIFGVGNEPTKEQCHALFPTWFGGPIEKTLPIGWPKPIGTGYAFITTTNIVSNGNFASSTGWSGNGGSVAVANNAITVTGTNATGTTADAVQTTSVTWVTGKKVYIRCKATALVDGIDTFSVRCYSSGGGTTVQAGSVSSPVKDTEYTVSGIATLTAQTAGTIIIVLRGYDAEYLLDKTFKFKEAMAIDLTSLFGAGNEPSVTQCDDTFSTWFDGTAIKPLSFSSPKPLISRWASVSTTNLASNGNMVDGISGWYTANSTVSVANNTLSVIGNGVNAYVSTYRQELGTVNVAHKYYTRAKVKVTNSACNSIRFVYDGSDAGTNKSLTAIVPTQNVTYLLSAVDTPPTDATGNFKVIITHGYADATTANGKVMEVQEFMVVDLTATFGAGNEPTAKQCDVIFANWFNGTIQKSLPTNWPVTPVPFTVTNVVNGGFASTSGWYPYDNAPLSVSNNIASVTGNGAAATITLVDSTAGVRVLGHRFYVRSRIRVTDSSCTRIRVVAAGGGWLYVDNPVQNRWYELSAAFTAASTSDSVFAANAYYADAATANGKVMQIEKAFAVDLTAVFGAGLEPQNTLHCDDLFKRWFSGTVKMSIPQYPGILGSQPWAAGDTNDPLITGYGYKFDGTNDYIVAPVVVDFNKDITVYVVADVPETNTSNGTYVCLSHTTLSGIFTFNENGSGGIYATQYNDANATTPSDPGIISANMPKGIRLMAMKKVNNQFFVKDIVSGVTSSAYSCISGTVSLNRMTLGSRLKSGIDRPFNKSVYWAGVYQSGTSDQTDKMVERYVRNLLAKKGVVLS